MQHNASLSWYATIKDPDIERGFIRYYAAKTRGLFLGCIAILLAVEALGLGLDIYGNQGAANNVSMAIARAAAFVLEICCGWLIYRYPDKDYWPRVTLIAGIMLLMLWPMLSHGSYSYIIPINLICTSLAIYVLAPIDWSLRVVFNLLFTMAGMAIWLQFGPDDMDVNRVIVWLIFAQSAGILSAYINSRNNRIVYLQRMRLNEQLEREKQLVQRNNTIMDVLSHEVRTPLTTINLQTEMLQRTNAANNIDDKIIQRIKQTSQHLVQILDSWILSGKELDFSPSSSLIDPAQIITQCVDKQPNQTVTVITKPLPKVHFDERILLVAIRSLLNNCQQHGKSKHGCRISSYVNKGQVQICIRDWGKGMSQEQQLTLFDRHSSQAQSDANGLGVGLHLLRKLIHSSGGDIMAKSSKGVGALIILSIPIAKAS